jgi:hypothetical protein
MLKPDPGNSLKSSPEIYFELVARNMAGRSAPPTPSPEPHTRAWRAFEENLESISHMVSFGRREIDRVQAGAKRLSIYMGKRDLAAKAEAARVRRSVKRFLRTITSRIDRYQTANLWQVVMLVTCVEAYLQDLLVVAASAGPELMSKSQQVASYPDVIGATSLEELASDLRTRWARGWLSEGGPSRWISRLKRMGARGYPDRLGLRLELFWGIRQVVVHSAGIATKDFVRRHPGVVARSGDRVLVSSRDFGAFLEAVKGFMNPTEQFFLARYPSLVAPPPTITMK